MDKEKALQTIAPVLAESGCFLVGLDISKDNDITIAIEKEHGQEDLDNCNRLNEVFVEAGYRDTGD